MVGGKRGSEMDVEEVEPADGAATVEPLRRCYAKRGVRAEARRSGSAGAARRAAQRGSARAAAR